MDPKHCLQNYYHSQLSSHQGLELLHPNESPQERSNQAIGGKRALCVSHHVQPATKDGQSFIGFRPMIKISFAALGMGAGDRLRREQGTYWIADGNGKGINKLLWTW